jgi:streptomycin 3"-adenylyltransferase
VRRALVTVVIVTDVGWRPQAALVAAFFEETLGSAASGVLVHGSAALGGWTSSSDLDMLITSEVLDQDWLVIGRRLLNELSTGPSVELSVVSAAAAARPEPPWPFLLHVNQAEGRAVADDGRGDPDLVMHYLATRDSGLAITGQPVDAAVGVVPRTLVLRQMRDELTWAMEQADQRYAVLNACRALAYSRDGCVLSKIDGGVWALGHGFDAAIVESALAAQLEGSELGRLTRAARLFVERCRAELGPH